MSKKTKYVFRRLSDDKRITRMMTHSRFERCRLFGTRFCLPDGSDATLIEDAFSKRAKVTVTKLPTRKHGAFSKPQISTSLKVHPMQVAAFNERSRVHGTGARYQKDGTCELSSRSVRKRECALRGVFDEDAGYGDQAPQSSE